MGYANATGPSVRHTITTSPRLAALMAETCAAEGITASELVRRWAAAYYGDPSVAEMRPKGWPPRETSGEKPAKTQAKRKSRKKPPISHNYA